MDPNACLERLRIAYCKNDFDEIEAAANDLLSWINKGGFLPQTSEPQLSALLIMAREYSEHMLADPGFYRRNGQSLT